MLGLDEGLLLLSLQGRVFLVEARRLTGVVLSLQRGRRTLLRRRKKSSSETTTKRTRKASEKKTATSGDGESLVAGRGIISPFPEDNPSEMDLFTFKKERGHGTRISLSALQRDVEQVAGVPPGGPTWRESSVSVHFLL